MANVSDIVERVMSGAGVPLSIWGPIMQIESGGNPSAGLTNGVEDSIGLFALNRKGGLGSGYTVAQLQDPETNARIASKSMGPAYRKGLSQGLSGLDLLRFTAYNGGWPTSAGVDMLQTNQTVRNYDLKLVREYNGGEGGGGSLNDVYSGFLSSGSSILGKFGLDKLTKGQQLGIVGVGAGIIVLLSLE